MDDTKADILMLFLDENGQSIDGESTLQSAPGDTFMAGFEPTSDADDYSNFFEVKNFSFSVKTQPKEDNVGANSKTLPKTSAAHGTGASTGGMAMNNAALMAAISGKAATAPDPFERWRSLTDSQTKTVKFPVSFDSFQFDRVIDAASTIFFYYCANQKRFQKAILVKRQLTKLAGVRVGIGTSNADMQSVGFLRFTFDNPMITSLNWDDGDMVTEKCTMVCDNMKVEYRQQNADGTLKGDTLPPAQWNRDLNSKAQRQGTT